MTAFDQAWSLLKAIRTTQNPGKGEPFPRGYSAHSSEGMGVPRDPGKEAAFFRESMPNFPLARFIQAGSAGRRVGPLSPHDKDFDRSIPDITRQSNYQFAPKFDQYGMRVHNANYQTGEPRTHYPDKDSPQRFIDDLARPIEGSEEDIRQQSYPFQGTRQATHPTQKELDELNYTVDEYRNMTDSQLPRLNYESRHSYDMTPPRGLDSVFGGHSY